MSNNHNTKEHIILLLLFVLSLSVSLVFIGYKMNRNYNLEVLNNKLLKSNQDTLNTLRNNLQYYLDKK